MEDLIADHKPPGQTSDADAPALAFEYPKEAIISYAQTREDVLLWRALHTVHRGFYVDIGAHDPTDLSVTRAFYDLGWRGINVEPNPYYAEKLRNERPRDVTLEVALGHSPGTAAFYEFGDTGLSTLVKEIADEHMAAGFTATQRRVPITTLAAVLDDLGDQEVHFLKIDVEGYERQVLRGADFAKVRPWIVLIEAVRPMTSIPSFMAWEPILLEAGYEFVYFDGLNRFYVAEEHHDLGRYFSAPVSICDPFRDSESVRLSAAIAELERDNAQQAGEMARLSEVAADLERDRMAQASEVVRLSEVAADLERNRAMQASEVVRLSEVAADLERDRMAQASEVARLSDVVSQLRRDRMKHEVPRLGGSPPTPIAGDAGDAEALLQIVEAQASDLVRLRRALLSAHTLADQRLQLVQSVHADAVARESRGDPEQWVRSAAVAEIARVEDAIGDVVERSRWRRAGQRLGLAKRLAWETEDWRTDFAVAGAGSSTGADGRGPEPSTAELLRELERLHGLLHHMRLSRWRKLGQWLGLAKRLPWESGGWPDPLLIRPFPSAEATPTPERRNENRVFAFEPRSDSSSTQTNAFSRSAAALPSM